jgi:hypothetical protein
MGRRNFRKIILPDLSCHYDMKAISYVKESIDIYGLLSTENKKMPKIREQN